MEHEHLLLCDGSSFDTTKYVQLAELFSNGKLPDLNGRFLQGSTTAGQMIEAGLPNITGSVYIGSCVDSYSSNGCFYRNNTGAHREGTPASSNPTNDINFDASKANAIYGKSNTVQPPAYTVKYYICYGG